MKFSAVVALACVGSASAFSSYLDNLGASSAAAPAAPASTLASEPAPTSGSYLSALGGNAEPLQMKAKPVSFLSNSMGSYLDSLTGEGMAAASSAAPAAAAAAPAAPAAPAASSGFEAFLSSQPKSI